MEKLERKIPPVALFIVLGVVMNHVGHEFHTFSVGLPIPWIVLLACFAISVFVGLAGVYEFRKANTTVNPVKVKDASQVVDSGVFAYSRNPMYLGMFLLLLGFAYWQQNLLCIALAFVFVLYMNRFQISPEERALEELFGAAYLDYKQRVRRWI
ncbi:isoprenylcysteine carboxylmethyltransferase family protein [Vibrio coralliilyticus]|uniref:methyltransferase family protein n=1 Tax=Vibrio coralliilyticus TaxID=190893 RepID=UPI00148DE988|nr:isoprenylcysteine carboxylmethyltransferase family protein [Vibrio coralliilyticus]NOH54080.1 isoprenylcysteine carboxylmethyltransferase family protein [Vibrio coralliilyticus]NRF28292.1 isoprenylcysteine carboxylmethyltransferase family protein [Vibrio coralliilyticus]NRF51897.1 isoprenylcysteine carboxylmethyltransferase family protein [Vibrio coralliilyticus]NRG03882.1 isoprenylcysteine carboxylmethyltransferase family protein [Vibrio coralliilyticus]